MKGPVTNPGRGRGNAGRQLMRSPKPGGDDDAARMLAELSPRTTVSHRYQDKSSNKEKTKVEYHVSGEDEAALKELLKVEDQYTPLLALLEEFSPGEDRVAFHRKLETFETTVNSLCTDETKLHQAFAAFRAAALLSSETARKLATVGASFSRQERQQLLREALLNVVIYKTFSKLDVLERADTMFLINAANLMGDYFAELRLCNGDKLQMLAGPLLQYMKVLLASNDVRAHRCLATQLMKVGRKLLLVRTQGLHELSISIRLRLLVSPPTSIIWLLLSADLCLNEFLALPGTLQQFYAPHLAVDDNYSEVSYGSCKESAEKEFYCSDVSSDLDKTEDFNNSDISEDLGKKEDCSHSDVCEDLSKTENGSYSDVREDLSKPEDCLTKTEDCSHSDIREDLNKAEDCSHSDFREDWSKTEDPSHSDGCEV